MSKENNKEKVIAILEIDNETGKTEILHLLPSEQVSSNDNELGSLIRKRYNDE